MKIIIKLITVCIAFFTFSQLAFAAYSPNAKIADKNIKPNIISAWQKAGALYAWLVISKNGQWQYLKSKPENADSLPVFYWHKYKKNVIARLSAPAVPFALALGGTGMTNSGLKELAKLQYLRALDISHTKVTDSGLSLLAPLKNLHSLDFGASAVTDLGLKHLASVTSLRALFFGSTAVSDDGVKELSRLTYLHTLYLYNTKVTDASLRRIAEFPRLRSLLITKTMVSDEGVAILKKARPKLIVVR